MFIEVVVLFLGLIGLFLYNWFIVFNSDSSISYKNFKKEFYLKKKDVDSFRLSISYVIVLLLGLFLVLESLIVLAIAIILSLVLVYSSFNYLRVISQGVVYEWMSYFLVFLIILFLIFQLESFVLISILILVCLSLVFTPIRYFSSFLFFFGVLYVVFINYNYIFLILLCGMLGLLVLNLIRTHLKIPQFVYLGIGVFLVLHVIWWSYLPLGFEQEYSLVEDGSRFSISSGDEINGLVTVKFDTLFDQDYILNVSVIGDEIYLMPQYIDINTTNWQYNWIFNNSIPDEFKIEYKNEFNISDIEFNNCGMVFDSNTRLTLPNSTNRFEDGPFKVFVEWTPYSFINRQQLVGHFNWEIYQNSDSVSFHVGRMDDGDDETTGGFYDIEYFIEDDTFFNSTNTLMAVYNPSDNGYIELFVNYEFVGREYFGNQTIRKDYGRRGLSIGHTYHGGDPPYLNGCLNNIAFDYNFFEYLKSKNENFSNNNFLVHSNGGILEDIKVVLRK